MSQAVRKIARVFDGHSRDQFGEVTVDKRSIKITANPDTVRRIFNLCNVGELCGLRISQDGDYSVIYDPAVKARPAVVRTRPTRDAGVSLPA